MKVCEMSDGRIPWPLTRHKRGKPFLIVCGGLAKAVRRESEIAVAYWWGVTAQTVWQWRKALGVLQVNEGTARLYHDYAPERLPPEVQAKARAAANSPAANAKKAAARQGKPAHPNQAKALAAGRRKNQSPEARRKRGESHRRRGTIPSTAGRPWTAEEDALLGTMPDEDVTQKTGRTPGAVMCRRWERRVPKFGSRGRGFAQER
jgi:hypothetical protein